MICFLLFVKFLKELDFIYLKNQGVLNISNFFIHFHYQQKLRNLISNALFYKTVHGLILNRLTCNFKL